MFETKNISCSTCHIRRLCLPQDISDSDLNEFNQSVKLRKTVKKGRAHVFCWLKVSLNICHTNRRFKTFLNNEHGYGHLTGFQMAGTSIGFDGIANSIHTSDATALEDSSVCVIPFNKIKNLSRKFPKFQRRFLINMSNEISRENKNLMYFYQMTADQKVASFLNDLLAKLKLRGFSEKELNLRMSHLEIGQHLGLTIETISRTFSKLVKKEVLTINKRHVTIINKPSLDLICQFK